MNHYKIYVQQFGKLNQQLFNPEVSKGFELELSKDAYAVLRLTEVTLMLLLFCSRHQYN